MNTAKADSATESEDLKEPLDQFSQSHGLSKREKDVLTLLANQVVSAEDISTQLGISRNTVRIHLKNINNKVGTTSKSELLGKFIEFVIQGQSSTEGETLIPPSTETELASDLLVLIADDDESYVELVRKASQSAISGNIIFQHVSNGQELVDYFQQTKKGDPQYPRPQIILLDLNMPKMNGFQALEKLKTDPMLSEIPVVVFTSSSTKSDVSSIYALGGNSYVTKPGGYQQLKQVMHGIVSYWGRIGVLPNTSK